MATPNSKTAIANLALRHLKIDPVTSIDPPDEDSKAAQAAADWYDQARRDTLEAHPWKFATKRRSLVADASAPGFEYTKKYELPSDFIRVNRIGENWDNPQMDYEIEDGFILCDLESPLLLVYVYNLSDATKFSPKFVTSLSYKLAAFMAFEMTGNAQLVQAMEAQFVGSLTQAASVSGQNRPTRRVEHSRLKAIRQSTGRARDWRRWGDD
jgi:hypothetical protein